MCLLGQLQTQFQALVNKGNIPVKLDLSLSVFGDVQELPSWVVHQWMSEILLLSPNHHALLYSDGLAEHLRVILAGCEHGRIQAARTSVWFTHLSTERPMQLSSRAAVEERDMPAPREVEGRRQAKTNDLRMRTESPRRQQGSRSHPSARAHTESASRALRDQSGKKVLEMKVDGPRREWQQVVLALGSPVPILR